MLDKSHPSNVMQSQGNYSLEKLCAIQLIEANINLYFKQLWGMKLVKSIINTNLFLPEQFRNHPGTFGMSWTLIKVLPSYLIRLLRVSATIFYNNTKACYKRVLPFLALLCCMHLDLPQ